MQAETELAASRAKSGRAQPGSATARLMLELEMASTCRSGPPASSSRVGKIR
jgi:hypothetical protein